MSTLEYHNMEWHKLLILFVTQMWMISKCTATDVLYVLPNNSTNVSCPSQPCATLSQYLLDNGTLPIMSNVEYHFLSGEHHVSAYMTLQDLENFSIIGDFSKTSSQTVLVACTQASYIMNIVNSYNITIANVMFKQHHQLNLQINLCYSCIMENVIFINSGLIATNLIGRSYLIKIKIKSSGQKPNYSMHCPGIILYYWTQQSFTDHDNKHILIMNQISINGSGNKCYSNGPVGIHIEIRDIQNLTIMLTNSLFYALDYTALSIISGCNGNNTINIENSTFTNNALKFGEDFQVTTRPLIDVMLSQYYKLVSFKQCIFKQNYRAHVLISFVIQESWRCVGNFKRNYYTNHLTNISFVECQFTNIAASQLITLNGNDGKVNLLVKGPSHFTYNLCKINKYKEHTILSINNMVVNIIGPLRLSFNHAHQIMQIKNSHLSFHYHVIFESNICSQVMYLQSTCIEVMEYSNITLFNNRYKDQLIKVENDYKYNLYPLCLFQFMMLRNTTVTASPMHYSVNVLDNSYYRLSQSIQSQMCLFSFYHFTPNCQWLPNGAFHDYNPKIIYQQIIKINNQNSIYHKICQCTKNESSDCNADVLGPVYPGQRLQVELCTPCNDEPLTLYAEINSIHLPDSACKVAPQTDIINAISKYSKTFTFIIVSEVTSVCELFLIASSDTQTITEVFYVQLLACPVGFTLQSGACNCDPILSPYIDGCYIDYASISRPRNTWITAHTQVNKTKYLISDCPMDYCLPYPSYVNLSYPNVQCQFNRTGILCSECEHPHSMVFGSSRCMECTNLYILMTLIVVVAGIILVVLLYLLNLTVPTGNINGIIFYANIVSINDSIFLVNDNVLKPLRVFISFVNLDLGIEICFYNGMDSYAKMWLQLVFPLYLIIIAALIIIASRYSSRILRLTYTRSLPVLATLFLLSYTGVLRTVLTVLFSYSTITHLPSGHQQMVWSIDASVPFFGWKFTILFITCLVLFLLLIPFSITLLFTRYLLQFRFINRFKPILDAFQGSYKDRYYYWVAVHMTMRSVLFAMYAFQTNLKLVLSTVVLINFGICSGYIRPHKNKLVNIQELLLLINLIIMYAVSYQGSEKTFSIVINVLISMALIQLFVIMLYHFFTYTCHFNIEIALQTLKHKLVNLYYQDHLKDTFDVELLNIPECTYNYAEYQDGLVSDDFK